MSQKKRSVVFHFYHFLPDPVESGCLSTVRCRNAIVDAGCQPQTASATPTVLPAELRMTPDELNGT